MKRTSCKCILFFFLLLTFTCLYAQDPNSSIYMDFRNQKISDIIYSVADVCGESVIIDETITGNATFRFEDKNFESALNRFAKHCQLYVEKNNDVYYISKVNIQLSNNSKLYMIMMRKIGR